MKHTPVSHEVLSAFSLKADPAVCLPYGNGHINDTFFVETAEGDTFRHYILQRLNTDVFKKPEELMENVVGITTHLSAKIHQAGGCVDRETLQFLPARDGRSFYVDSEDSFWRLTPFVEDIICLEQVTCPEDFYNSALTFGHFQNQLSDYPAASLHETIPNFHNTPVRFENFASALGRDSEKRACTAPSEIEFVLSRKAYTRTLVDQQAAGILPLRVTHNDTKLNNILFDRSTGKGICVIDLDTVMPGLVAYDFGDSIRFGATTAKEDEQDLSKVHFDILLFETYVRGFIEGCGGALTDAELSSLIDGGIMMTLECGIRFLTDYLEGDHYFKTDYPEHNLVRTRTQFRLVEEMEQCRPELEEIIKKYRSR